MIKATKRLLLLLMLCLLTVSILSCGAKSQPVSELPVNQDSEFVPDPDSGKSRKLGERNPFSTGESEEIDLGEVQKVATFEKLKQKVEAGYETIRITADITLTDTIYVPGKTTISASENHTLTRSPDFAGDLFILGVTSTGEDLFLAGKTASLTLAPDEGVTLSLDGNKANMNTEVAGTAFFLQNSATLNLYNGFEIVNCKKTANALLVDQAHHISDANLAGGAAVIIANGAFNMYGGAIRDCEVNPMDVKADGAPQDTSTTPAENPFRSSRGGAVFNYGTFRMYGGVIENCTAGRGGAIYSYRIAYLLGGRIADNSTATYGGALYLPNSQYAYCVIGPEGIDIAMTISGNTAQKSGGAVFFSHQAVLYVRGGTLFSENRSLGGNGGAINAAGALVIDYAEFEKNAATSKGGAVYSYYNEPNRTRRNTEIKAAVFRENEASRGGAIGIGKGDDVKIGVLAYLGDVTFIENKATQSLLGTTNKYGYGGAVHIDNLSTMTVTGSTTFRGNTADDNGGAVYVTKQSTFQVSPSAGETVTFRDNTAKGNGGAVYNSNSTVTLTAAADAAISIEGNSAQSNGGAFAVHSGGTTRILGAEIRDNTAGGNGGAVYVNDSYAVVGKETASGQNRLTHFSGNKANSTSYGGGAIYNTGGTVTLSALGGDQILLEKNQSAKNGGAIAVYSSGTVQMNGDVTLSENTAKTDGGALYANNSTVRAEMLTATENSASGGGALYAKNATVDVTTCTLTGNTVTGNGGAIYCYTSTKAHFGTLVATENQAKSGYGGVLYLSEKSETVIDSIQASENIAKRGGCINITVDTTSVSLGGGDIRGNIATSVNKGNAIWSNQAGVVVQIDSTTLLYGENDIQGEAVVQDLGA